MLSRTDAAVIRAALRYWSDEIVPGGKELGQHYVDEEIGEMLSPNEVESLIRRFRWESLLSVEVDSESGLIESDRLLPQCRVDSSMSHRVLSVIGDDSAR